MSEPLRDAASFAGPDASVHRDAHIEQLLLIGLDRYFAGEYDQAIHVWTRVLFLDRGQARARAYIERARGAIAERQREAEEMLQRSLAAFDRGDIAAARRLVRAALDRGGPQDEALALLDRLDRLDPATPPAEATPRRGALGARWRRTSRAAPAGRRSVVRTLLLLAAVAGLVLAALAYATAAWPTLPPWLPSNRVAPGTVSSPVAIDPVPLPPVSEIALDRARRLFDRGHLHDALRALEAIRPGDALRGEADLLREKIQRALLAGAGPHSAPAGAEAPSAPR